MCVDVCVHLCGSMCAQPTPAYEHVASEGGVAGDDQEQGVKVQPLHQQPEEVGHDKVVKKHHTDLAAHLQHREQLVCSQTVWADVECECV